MASMSMTITEFADNGNSRTYTRAGHTAVKPKLVTQKRIVPVGNQVMSEFEVTVSSAVLDPDGGIAPQKVLAAVKMRYPISGVDPTDLASIQTEILTAIKDVAASDEFAASVLSQNFFT